MLQVLSPGHVPLERSVAVACVLNYGDARILVSGETDPSGLLALHISCLQPASVHCLASNEDGSLRCRGDSQSRFTNSTLDVGTLELLECRTLTLAVRDVHDLTVEGALVTTWDGGPSETYYTDENGAVALDNITAGTRFVRIDAFGYLPECVALNGHEGATLTATLRRCARLEVAVSGDNSLLGRHARIKVRANGDIRDHLASDTCSDTVFLATMPIDDGAWRRPGVARGGFTRHRELDVLGELSMEELGYTLSEDGILRMNCVAPRRWIVIQLCDGGGRVISEAEINNVQSAVWTTVQLHCDGQPGLVFSD